MNSDQAQRVLKVVWLPSYPAWREGAAASLPCISLPASWVLEVLGVGIRVCYQQGPCCLHDCPLKSLCLGGGVCFHSIHGDKPTICPGGEELSPCGY